MTERRESVERALRDLAERAQAEDVEIDESFYTELRNYARHEKVEELDGPVLAEVVTNLGQKAIQEAPSRRVGGGHVRAITFQLCDDPFTDCSEAAARISRTAARTLRKIR